MTQVVSRVECREAPPHHNSYVAVDVETMNWLDDVERRTENLTFGLAVTWQGKGGFIPWMPDQLRELQAYLKRASFIVGYNLIQFDLPVIYRVPYAPPGASAKPYDPPSIWQSVSPNSVYDLFDVIRKATGRWVSLDRLAKLNGVGGKAFFPNGKKAAHALAEGDTVGVLNYCKQDVILVMSLCDQFREREYLLIPEVPKRGQLGLVELVLS